MTTRYKLLFEQPYVSTSDGYLENADTNEHGHGNADMETRTLSCTQKLRIRIMFV